MCQHRHRHTIFCILPPYLLGSIAQNGTSAQRVRWFKRGFETGDLKGMQRLFEEAYERL